MFKAHNFFEKHSRVAKGIVILVLISLNLMPLAQAFAQTAPDSSDSSGNSSVSAPTSDSTDTTGTTDSSQTSSITPDSSGVSSDSSSDDSDASAPADNTDSTPSADDSSAATPDSSLAATPPTTSTGPDTAFSSPAALSKYSAAQIATANKFDLSPALTPGIASGKYLNSYQDLTHYPTPTSVSGAFTYDVPIEVPPGRNGIQPNLKISYDNQDQNDQTIFGNGWSINIPYIERLDVDGNSNLYNEYNFSSTLDGQFATSSYATTTGQYAAEYDNGNMDQYTFASSTQTWTMVDKDGTQYTFGSTTSARLYDSGNSSHVVIWYLQQVQDTNGNSMTYNYTLIGSQVYPTSITYTAHNGSAGPYEVDFTHSYRSFDPASYKYGFEFDTGYHITEIDVKFNGNTINKYALNYTTGTNGERDLLQSVTQTGYDDNGVATTLSPLSFGYQQQTTTWATTTPANALPPLVDSSGNDLGYRFFNWDWFNGTYAIHMSPFYRSGYEAPDWTNVGYSANNIPTLVDDSNHDIGSAIVDVNGDGMPDIIQGKEGSYDDIYLWQFNGATYVSASTTMTNIPYLIDSSGNDLGVRFGDFNGDGFEDYIISTTTGAELFINKADGTGWKAGVPITGIPSFIDASGNDSGARIMDINGDGIDDIVYYPAAAFHGQAFLNEGNGTTWTEDTAVESGIPIISGPYGASAGTDIVDIDGDGLEDFVVSTPNRGTKFFINTGQGWVQEAIAPIPFFLNSTDCCDIGTRLMDGNTDNIPDFVTSNSSTSLDYMSSGHPVDQLDTVTLPTGGSISVTYQGTRVGATVLNTVKTITTNPGLGEATTTHTYAYANGEYTENNQDRRFAGFAEVYDTDNLNNETLTYYHQGNGNNLYDPTELYDSYAMGEYNDTEGKMYQPYLIEQYSGAPYNLTLQKKTINKIDSKSLGNGRTLIFTADTVTYAYDGLSTHADSAISYDYATSTGNLIQQINWGQVTGNSDGTFTDTGTDDYTTNYTYASSASSSVTDQVSDAITTNHSGTKISETQHYYDGLALGSIGLGNETKTAQWKSGTSYASTTKAYNSFGLVASSTDADSHLTSYVYDTYNLYPATTTNALSQSTAYTYDYLNGKVEKTIDPNGLVNQTTYDGIGRVSTSSVPDLTTPSTLDVKTAFSYTDTGYPSVHEKDYLNSATTTDTYSYEDGLGRTIQQRKSTENSGIYDITDTLYNSQGLVAQQSLPYFSSGSASTTATTTSALFTYNQYDTLGRLGTTTNAVGTTTNQYENWMIHTTDPRFKVKNYYYDAYNNLDKIDEIVGTSSQTTYYTYDGLKDLTNITDALGNVRNFTYDGMGRELTSQDLHASGDTSFGSYTYTYDDAGNLTQQVDPKSQTVNYTYDALERPLTEDYTSATGTEVMYGYDSCTYGIGHMCSATTTSATINYAYDSNGNKATESATIKSSNYTTQYAYDRQGNITNITYPDNSQVVYTYGTGGSPATVAQKVSGGSFAPIVSSFGYAPTGQASSTVYANGVRTSNTYDPGSLYRLKQILTTTTATSSPLQNISYTYDANGNVTQINDTSSTTAAKLANYVYDDLNRLTSATITATSTAPLGWYNSGWGYRIPITASSSKVLEDTHDVYFDLSVLPSSFFSNIKANGCDIRVTKSDGTTELPIDIPSVGTSTGQLFFSTGNALSSTSSSMYYIYYGNPSASCYAANATYGANNVYDANTIGVWHLEQNASTTGAIIDSTSHGHNGTMFSNYVQNANGTSTGKMGAGAYFNGTNDTIDVPNSSDFLGNTFTIESWVNLAVTPSTRGENANLVTQKSTGSPYQAYASYISSPDNRDDGDWFNASSTGFYAGTYAGGIATSTWHYITLREDPASTTVNLSVRTDASATNTYTATTTGSTFSANDVLRFGADYAGGGRLDGTLDEVRYSNVARDDNYLTTRYNDMNSPSTFWSIGSSTSAATSTGGSYTQTYTYDALGNITNKSDVGAYLYQGNTGTNYANPDAPTSIAGNNYIYDNNGNLTSGGGITNTWDYRNELATSVKGNATSTYGYDQAGNRVFATIASTTTIYPNKYYNTSASSTTDYIFANGTQIASVDTSSASSGTTTTQSIYTDSLNASWSDWSFNDTNNFSATSTVYSGTYSIQATYTGTYGGLYLHNTGFSTATSTALQFAFRSPTASPSLQVLAYGSSGSPLGSAVSLNGYVPGGTIAANTWYLVTIPLSALSDTATTTTGYVFQDAGAGTVYYDSIAVIATSTGGTPAIHYVSPDNLGSTNVVTDSSGNLVETLDYYPYGQNRIDATSGYTGDARKYIGQYLDSATNLSYLNARYYNNVNGQFLSEDPVFVGDPKAQDLENPQNLNSYSYAVDNPIVKKDPSGKCLEDACVVEVAVITSPEWLPTVILGAATISASITAALRNIPQWDPSDFTEYVGVPEPDYEGGQMPNMGPNPPWWGIAGVIGAGVAEIANDVYDKVQEIQQTANTLKPAPSTPKTVTTISSANTASTGSINYSHSTTQTYIPTTPYTPTAVSTPSVILPATVTQGGVTYYRNSWGLLSLTPGQ